MQRKVLHYGTLFLFIASCSSQANDATNTDFFGLNINVSLRLDNSSNSSNFTVQHKNEVETFFKEAVQEACGETCNISRADVSVNLQHRNESFLLVAGVQERVFHMNILLKVQENSNLQRIQMSSLFSITSELEQRATQTSFRIVLFSVLFFPDNSRKAVCGDGKLGNGEMCDDANDQSNDGCSSACTLEEGYMCYSSVRLMGPDTPHTDTYRVQWDVNTTITPSHKTLRILNETQSCLSNDICKYDTPWQPLLWSSIYHSVHNTTEFFNNMDATMVLPPAGYYCNKFCEDTFVPPSGFEFSKSCQPRPIDECIRGLTTCHENAYCLEPPDGIGYSCRCDENNFVLAAAGSKCSESGVEIVVNVTGRVNSQAFTRPEMLLEIEQARLHLINAILQMNLVSDESTPGLLIEGVVDYPLEIIQNDIVEQGVFQGRSLWRIILRIPSQHVNMQLLSNSNLFRDYLVLAAVFPDDSTCLLHSVQQCDNDRRRNCAQDSDCLNQGKCDLRAPDVSMRILSAGGSTAPLQISSSGSSIMSTDYDVQNSAFNIRLR